MPRQCRACDVVTRRPSSRCPQCEDRNRQDAERKARERAQKRYAARTPIGCELIAPGDDPHVRIGKRPTRARVLDPASAP